MSEIPKSNQPVLDTKTLEELAATTDAEFVGDLIDTFTADSPELLAQLRQALADRNAETFRRAAHSLKSNGNSLGALALATQARELEMQGKAGTIDGSAAAVESLAAELEKTARELQKLRRDRERQF